jgi:hypothetical protein
MNGKRTHNVMLRLTAEEHAALVAAAPAGDELAAFARRTLLQAINTPAPDLRRTASFIVAALSPEIGYEEALALFDENVRTATPTQED